MNRWLVGLIGLIGLVVVLASCGESDLTSEEQAVGSSESDLAGEQEAASFGWESCGEAECGFLEVPIAYENPGGSTLRIAVARAKATGPDQLGVLIVQAGGPGQSSIELVQDFARTNNGAIAELREVFDLVAVDSRGVGESEPAFACGEPGTYQYQELVGQLGELPTTPEEFRAGEDAIQLCVESMGEAAAHLGTATHVSDIDSVREALGEDQVSFIGFSYGSEVGGWYASTFPERVRAMVVDAALTPFVEDEDFETIVADARQGSEPIEQQLRDMLEECNDDACPAFNNGDPVGFYLEAIQNGFLIDEQLNVAGAQISAVFEPLYSEDRRPAFYSALAALNEGDPGPMSDIAEGQYLGFDPAEVNYPGYVSCLDTWERQPDFDRQDRLDSQAAFNAALSTLDDEFPLLRAAEAGVERGNPCPFMDILDIPASNVEFGGGDAPILVVGNILDPITDLAGSAEFAELFTNGILVTANFPRHTVFPDEDCVNRLVVDALIDIEYPAEAVSCA